MLIRRSLSGWSKPTLPCCLFGALLVILWCAGGASRSDVLGQVVVRGVCWILLVTTVLFCRLPRVRAALPAMLFLTAIAILAIVQLIPLPPSIWQTLPGRAIFIDAALASGQAQPWRPLSISPGATKNAFSALVVPATALVLLMGLAERERGWLLSALLIAVVANTLLGLLQFAGLHFNNPFINEDVGQVSGIFANRNHFALFNAIGFLITPVWMFDGRRPGWRLAAGASLILLFLMALLASGSRAGLAAGALAIVIAPAIVWRPLKLSLSSFPKWATLCFAIGAIATICVVLGIIVLSDRAASINRLMNVDTTMDLRSRALPTMLEMAQLYFPAGAGLGTFDVSFRIHEPFDLLKPSYLNHAHDDFLELVMDGGLAGVALVLAAVLWWGTASFKAWRPSSEPNNMLAKLGSAIFLIVAAGSFVDYPVRTPMMMTLLVIASLWLGGGGHSSALRRGKRHLSARISPARDHT